MSSLLEKSEFSTNFACLTRGRHLYFRKQGHLVSKFSDCTNVQCRSKAEADVCLSLVAKQSSDTTKHKLSCTNYSCHGYLSVKPMKSNEYTWFQRALQTNITISPNLGSPDNLTYFCRSNPSDLVSQCLLSAEQVACRIH